MKWKYVWLREYGSESEAKKRRLEKISRENFTVCSPKLVLLKWWNKRREERRNMWQAGGEGTCVPGLMAKREGKRPYGKHRRRWEDNAKMYLENVTEWRDPVSSVTSGRLFYTWQWTSEFHRRQGNSRVAVRFWKILLHVVSQSVVMFLFFVILESKCLLFF
jgi:hypothetical protein